jgi:protein-tyrosine phosphatase
MIEHSPEDILNHLRGHKGFDYAQITDLIFIGTNMCCQYGFSVELLSKGVLADISMEQDHTDAPIGVDYFLWLPTEQEIAPTPLDFEIGVRFIDFATVHKIKTYIHCKNGHSRGPTLFAAYLISQGKSVPEALEFIVSKRPEMHLNEVQTLALGDFEKSLSKK